ncbi:transport and Golgi organization protein 1 homolog isoform X2 [Plectropomus leopardus]|uniref:transport and Golgi organization protein 1 homolog isoform X2 n=1 Tax=Plectropomus leopardus TaxID=160734 RepID=UPI001C4A86F0|nr:transport and Golgi organization protein 1 homolog isoform X2 [Plectropomus leopardus]
MTGWLGFGGEKKTDHSAEKEQDEEGKNDEEPAEKFRSRRMSLDLEGSQLQEEKTEMGTLGWLGNGLSSTLGFDLTNQESEQETTTEKEDKEEEQPASGSWLDMGIGDILGLRKDKSEADESAEEDKILEQPTESVNVDTSQSPTALTEDLRTETSNESNAEEDQNAPPEIILNADSNNYDISTSDSSNDSFIPEDTASKEFEKTSKVVDTIHNSSNKEGRGNVSDDHKEEEKFLGGERPAEMEDKDHQMPEKETETASDTDQDFLTQSDISVGSDVTSADLNSNSMGQSVEESKAEDVVEEEAQIPHQINNTEESTDTSVKIGASSHDHEAEGNKADVLYIEISTTQTDSAEQSQVSSVGQTQPFLLLGAADEKPVPNEDDSFKAQSVETDVDHSDSLTVTDSNTETQQGEFGQEREVHSVEDSSEEFGSSDIQYVNASEEDRGVFSTTESVIQMENNVDQDSELLQQGGAENDGDAHELKETVKETETDGEDEIQPVQTEIEDVEETKEGMGEREELKEVEEIDSEEKLQEVEQVKQDEGEELKDEGGKEEMEEKKQERIKELERETVDKFEENNKKQEEGEEIKEEEVRESKEEKKQGEEVNKEEKMAEMEKVNEEKMQEGMEELKEENQEVIEKLTENLKQEEVEEIKEDSQEQVGELKEEKMQEEVEELNEKEEKDEMEETLGEEKQEEVEVLREEDRQQKVEDFGKEKEREVEEVKKNEEEEHEEVLSSNFGVEMETSLHSSPHTQKDINNGTTRQEGNKKETQEENSSESVFSEVSTQTEKSPIENPQTEEQERVEEKFKDEVKEQEDEGNHRVENGRGERRDKEDEESLKSSNKFFPQASEDGSMTDSNGNGFANRLSSTDEGTMETEIKIPTTDGDQIFADGTGVSPVVPGIERDEEGTQEEENEEKGDNGVINNNDLSGQNSLPDQLSFCQTAENKEDDQLYSCEVGNTDLSDDNVLRQRDKTTPEDTETSTNGIYTETKTVQIHSGHETDTEEMEINGKHANMPMTNLFPNITGSELRTEERVEVEVSSGDPVISEQTGLSDGHNKGTAETGGGGAFGLFKNAFGFFSQTPVTETEGSAESEPSLDSNTVETSTDSLTPEQQLDSTTDPTQVYMQDTQTDSSVTGSQQQLEPSPTSTEPQTSSSSPTQTNNHPTESQLQTKPPTKHYKNLLAYMSSDEVTILTELFGRHKVQFLDYVLGSSETMTDDPDNDESILLDIERLLHYHRETLLAPSMKLADVPQEDKEKTRTLITLQKLEMLLARVRKTLSNGQSDIRDANHQAEASCVGASCLTHGKDQGMATEVDSSVGLDNNVLTDEWKGVDKKKDGRLSGGTGNEKRSEKERVSPESPPHIQPESPQSLEGVMKQILDFVLLIAEASKTHLHAVRELLIWLTVKVVSSLPDDIRPGPDLYGVPWEPVIISSLVGMMTLLLFTCRCYSSVKSRMYRSKERWMAEQVAQQLDEKCKVLETLSKCQQEYDDLESSLRDSGVLAQTQKTEHLEVKAKQLGRAKKELERDLEQLKDQLDQQREQRMEQEKRIAVLEESMTTFEEEIKDLQSQEEQAQTTLKVYNMNSDRLQRNLETAGEENTLLQESNAQLRQQVEGWAERVSELEAEMSRCEAAHSGMLQDVANKDERIMSLTDRLLRMKAWDSDLEEEEGEEGGEKETSNGSAVRGDANGRGDITDTQGHLQKVQKLIYAAKLNADLKSVDEDKDRIFAKLNDEVKAKEDLQESIKELDNEKLSLQSDTEQYADQVQRLQQKLQIMTEMYQENELKLHRLLTVEEKERMQKEEKLNKADKNIAMAMEELSNYRQRAGEMEEELEKTKQSYQTQISAHEKKAHNNWLAARAADRELADIRRENALFRQKLTDTQFKLDALDKDPYALNSLARPLPFRAERSPYGPSPLGRPASETRPFLSPPTLMDGPPARLSPRGYMFSEPGGPMYRRPPPPPGALGLLPPPGSLPPGPLHPRGLPLGPPYPADLADGSYRENSHGPGDLEHRESGPGERRTPPEADLRMGGPPPPGPPMGPMDGPFPRRAPYGPPPPDFYPPRGPGGPPIMPMWAPPPPAMMFPPRFPPGGPPLRPAPHPHYAPPTRPPMPDGHPHPSMGPLPPQQSLPSPPHSQSPEEHTPSPEDAI